MSLPNCHPEQSEGSFRQHRVKDPSPRARDDRSRWLLAALALILLTGCNAEERSHVVKLDKGGYAGRADSVLSDSIRLALRQRVALQSDGPAEVMVPGAAAVLVPANTPATGRIAGQNY